MSSKKKKQLLRLKPGNHQFVPGANSFHNNENTSSEDLAWYLEKYPHISSLLEEPQAEEQTIATEPDTYPSVTA